MARLAICTTGGQVVWLSASNCVTALVLEPDGGSFTAFDDEGRPARHLLGFCPSRFAAAARDALALRNDVAADPHICRRLDEGAGPRNRVRRGRCPLSLRFPLPPPDPKRAGRDLPWRSLCGAAHAQTVPGVEPWVRVCRPAIVVSSDGTAEQGCHATVTSTWPAWHAPGGWRAVTSRLCAPAPQQSTCDLQTSEPADAYVLVDSGATRRAAAAGGVGDASWTCGVPGTRAATLPAELHHALILLRGDAEGFDEGGAPRRPVPARRVAAAVARLLQALPDAVAVRVWRAAAPVEQAPTIWLRRSERVVAADIDVPEDGARARVCADFARIVAVPDSCASVAALATPSPSSVLHRRVVEPLLRAAADAGAPAEQSRTRLDLHAQLRGRCVSRVAWCPCRSCAHEMRAHTRSSACLFGCQQPLF